MGDVIRVVHYINQFFAGIGGEEKADIKPEVRDGASQSLADADPLADAVVTGGNANQVIDLPPMDTVIGDTQYVDIIAGGFDGSLREDGSIEVEIQAITGATNETGFNYLTARGK